MSRTYDITELERINSELLEALERMAEPCSGMTRDEMILTARAAISRATA